MANNDALPWCFGILLLGWGASILTGIVPHEDILVGAALTVAGLAVAMWRRNVPRLPRIHPAALALAGGALAAAGVWALARGFHAPKAALLTLGVALAACAPFQRRDLPVAGRVVPVSTVAWSVAAFAAGPVAVYATQGLFAGGAAGSPMEWFLAYGLVTPLAAIVAAFGWAPVQDGHWLTYATPRGPLRLEVGVACSGIQAMALFAAMVAVLIAVQRPPGKVAARLAAVGLVGVYVANVIRLTALAAVGYAWGPEALETAHAQAGWVVFVLWAMAFAAWARPRLQARPQPTP